MKAVEWSGGAVRILDQTLLPDEEAVVECRKPEEVAEAIRRLAVRGAPALGIAAAMGMALAAERSRARSAAALVRELERAGRLFVETRPTAANIAWAVDRVLSSVREQRNVEAARRAAVDEALAIELEDERACLVMGRLGQRLIPHGANVLTHCNTGLLCTGGIGTAMGVISSAHAAGNPIHVWVDETRPVLQGARLTAWELQRLGIPMTLVADSAAGHLMATGRVDRVVVGADRIAANGDVANKIGTYSLAVLAGHHRIPFYVVAPTSSIDTSARTGGDIRIEDRGAEEVVAPRGLRFAPEGTPALNPAFDVTPARLVSAIVTELGVVRPPYGVWLRRLLREHGGAGMRPRARHQESRRGA